MESNLKNNEKRKASYILVVLIFGSALLSLLSIIFLPKIYPSMSLDNQAMIFGIVLFFPAIFYYIVVNKKNNNKINSYRYIDKIRAGFIMLGILFIIEPFTSTSMKGDSLLKILQLTSLVLGAVYIYTGSKFSSFSLKLKNVTIFLVFIGVLLSFMRYFVMSNQSGIDSMMNIKSFILYFYYPFLYLILGAYIIRKTR